MRNVPNILTISRMLAAVLLLFCEPFSAWFTGVYLFAGATDMLDGMLARRLRVASALGARLDSVADYAFAFAALYKLIPAVPWERWMLFWIAGVACVRLITLCVGFYKYRALPTLHTWANKLAGGALFLFPALYRIIGLAPTAWLLCAIASVAAVEELVITLAADTLDRDRRGLLFLGRRHK